MYKIDICLHYMPCANCWVCMNHTKPNRLQGPNSKALELLETALCRPMPSGWHAVSSVQRVAQARLRPRSWNGLQMSSSTPSFCGQEAPGQGFRELARVTQHLQEGPHLGRWHWLAPPPTPQYRISLYGSSALALKGPSAASSYYCPRL